MNWVLTIGIMTTTVLCAHAGVAQAQTFNIADGDAQGLIDAIDACNANPGQVCTINLAANGTYALTSVNNDTNGNNGLPVIATTIIINGNGSVIERDTGTFFRILNIIDDGDLTLDTVTIRNGHLNWNTAGGILHTGAMLTLIDSTITENVMSESCGAGLMVGSTSAAIITGSTISHNSTIGFALGAGMCVSGSVTLINSTISNNSNTSPGSLGGGGIVLQSNASVTISNCTVVDNAAPGGTGNIRNLGGDIAITNSIISNTIGGDIFGTYTDNGYNIVRDGVGITHSTSMSGNPVLGSLANHGGATLTHAPSKGSPAINAGNCSGGVVAVDQRGVSRPQGDDCDIGAHEVQQTFLVPNGDTPGLIAALTEAGVSPSVATVNLAPHGTYLLTTALPGVDSPIVINGNNATLQQTGSSRILRVVNTPGADLTLNNLTLEGGNTGLDGGAIENGRTLTIHNSTITGCSARNGGAIYNSGFFTLSIADSVITDNEASQRGGGIFIGHLGPSRAIQIMNSTISNNAAGIAGGAIRNARNLELIGCTISGNSAGSGGGGGVFNTNPFFSPPAALTLVNSTMSGNSTRGNGGAVYNSGSNSFVTLRNATIAENSAVDGGGLRNEGVGFTISNSVVAMNSASDVSGFYTDDGHNIIGDGSGVTHATSMAGDPMLGPLDDNCGPTLTHAVLPGSPARNAGDCSGGTVTTDQRGFSRPQGVACDIGAYEAVVFQVPNGVVGALTSAINNANAVPTCTSSTIELAVNGLYVLTSVNNQSLLFGTNGLPVIQSNMVINGNGATIQRSAAGSTPNFRILEVATTGDLTLNEVTIHNGRAEETFSAPGQGGGILNRGLLEINRSTIRDNMATPLLLGTTSGGGIANASTGTLWLTNSTVSGNASTGQQFSDAGGIYNEGEANITNSTITENSAQSGGGISASGPTAISNSIIALNSGGNIVGGFTNAGFNIIRGNPNLGPLQDNGGPTYTHELLTGSPAIDAGDCAGGTITTDQRGVSRPQGAACDIGAYEVEVPAPPCPGDINNDQVVNGFDLVDLLSCWGPVVPGCEDADLNNDQLVNGFDLVDLLSNWGPCP